MHFSGTLDNLYTAKSLDKTLVALLSLEGLFAASETSLLKYLSRIAEH